VRGTRRDEEAVTDLQGERGGILDHHLHGPGEDVPDLLARMLISRPGIDEAARCTSVRVSVPASASVGWVSVIALSRRIAALEG
jgi:hypothetical protein